MKNSLKDMIYEGSRKAMNLANAGHSRCLRDINISGYPWGDFYLLVNSISPSCPDYVRSFFACDLYNPKQPKLKIEDERKQC